MISPTKNLKKGSRKAIGFSVVEALILVGGLFFSGCASSPRTTFQSNDSGRMAIQNYRAQNSQVAQATSTFRTGNVSTFEVGVTVPLSTDTTKNVPLDKQENVK